MELFLYREADTVLHRLDARTKILSLLAIFTVALLFSQPALQAGWLAVRWVPAFLRTAQAVVQAQQARGLDLQGGNVVARAGRYVPLMIPMMTHVIRQTLLLAMALEAKGFDPRAIRVSAGESRFTA